MAIYARIVVVKSAATFVTPSEKNRAFYKRWQAIGMRRIIIKDEAAGCVCQITWHPDARVVRQLWNDSKSGRVEASKERDAFYANLNAPYHVEEHWDYATEDEVQQAGAALLALKVKEWQ